MFGIIKLLARKDELFLLQMNQMYTLFLFFETTDVHTRRGRGFFLFEKKKDVHTLYCTMHIHNVQMYTVQCRYRLQQKCEHGQYFDVTHLN